MLRRRFDRTRAALAAYDRGESRRIARWERALTDSAVATAQRFDSLALERVHAAFALDTADWGGSKENAFLATLEYMRICAELEEVKEEVDV